MHGAQRSPYGPCRSGDRKDMFVVSIGGLAVLTLKSGKADYDAGRCPSFSA
jgi:hypothetical protein